MSSRPTVPTPSGDHADALSYAKLSQSLNLFGSSLTDAFSKLGASAAEAGKAFEKFGEALAPIADKLAPFGVAEAAEEEMAAFNDPLAQWVEEELDIAVQNAVQQTPRFEPPPVPGERKIDLDD